MRRTPRRIALCATLVSLSFFVATIGVPAPIAAATPIVDPVTAPVTAPVALPLPSRPTVTVAERVIASARTHLDVRYAWGAIGPRAFDCSGLVYRVFVDNGLGALIGYSTGAHEIYRIFRLRGLASRSNGRPGDLVVYGGGSHIGIYLGHGRVISALTDGVRIAGLGSLTVPFTAFLHTGLSSLSVGSIAFRRTLARVYLHVRPTLGSKRVVELTRGARITVFRSSLDGSGRRWLRVITPTGVVGWLVASRTH